MAVARYKLVLIEIRSHNWGTGQTFVFAPRYDTSLTEDDRLSKVVLSARFEMYIENLPVQESYKLGQAYYFDCAPVAA